MNTSEKLNKNDPYARRYEGGTLQIQVDSVRSHSEIKVMQIPINSSHGQSDGD